MEDVIVESAKGTEVLGEVGCELVRVEGKEVLHIREIVILEDATEAERSEERLQELVFVQYSAIEERISEPGLRSVIVCILWLLLLRHFAHKERRA